MWTLFVVSRLWPKQFYQYSASVAALLSSAEEQCMNESGAGAMIGGSRGKSIERSDVNGSSRPAGLRQTIDRCNATKREPGDPH